MSLGIVLRHSLALVVHGAEVELSVSVSLVGYFAMPLRGLGVVLQHSSVRVNVAKLTHPWLL